MAERVQTMSRLQVIEEFRRLAAQSATPLAATDLPYSFWLALRRHFGSIEDAREASGVQGPELARRWSEEKIIAEMRRLHAKAVRITDLTLKDEHPALLGAIREYFDGIVQARRAARLPEPSILAGKRQRWDEQRVIAEIEELHRSGESIAASKVPNPLLKAGKRYFGTWADAVEAAGHDYNDVRLYREPYTEEDVVDELRALAKQKPEMPWSEIYEQRFTPAILRLFGSAEAALERARLVDWPIRERLPAMSRAEVIAAIKQRERDGKDTNWETVNTEDHHLWYSGILHFGDWHRAAAAARVDTKGHNRRWTAESLLDALRDRDRRGLSLRPIDVQREDASLYASTRAYFGDYMQAVKRVAFAPWAQTRWTPELVIERLRAAARGGHRVTAREAGGRLVQASQLHFGSYTAACLAAGLVSKSAAKRAPSAPSKRRKHG